MSFKIYNSKSFFISFFILIPQILLSADKNFKNAYISFNMKDTWSCHQENSEFICRSTDPTEAKEAVIILTAKEIGPADTFEAYNEHLSKPINTTTKSGAPLISNVSMPPQIRSYDSQKWIDALHLNSEVKNYYTRYLATIKDKIAVLVTFSAHNNYYTKYSNQFTSTIQSIRLAETKDLTMSRGSGSLRGSNEMLGTGIGQSMPADLLLSDDASSAQSSKSKKGKGLLQNKLTLSLILIILAIVGYIGFTIYKKKK